MKHLFTIVTVVFNDVENVRSTINSVLSQSNSDYEYIIVDGNSSDGTIDCIKNSIAGKQNVVFVSEPDKGIYDAMNKAAMMANGEWICFMNSGDTFYTDNTLSEVSCYLSDDFDVVYGNTNMITENGFVIDYAKEPSYLLQNMPFCHQCAFARTSLLRSKLFDLSYRYVADYNFFYNSYVEGFHFKKVDLTIATYNTVEGFSASNKMKVFKEVLRVRKPTDNLINKLKTYVIYYRFAMMEKVKNHFPSLVHLLRYKKL